MARPRHKPVIPKMEQEAKGRMRILLAVMLLGVTAGAVLANTMDAFRYEELLVVWEQFLRNFGMDGISKGDIFIEHFVKYGKTAGFIWTLGFVAAGAVFVYFLLFLKGLGYGFTTAFVIKAFGWKGLLYAGALYVPQNLILIPAYLIISFFSLRYMRHKTNHTACENPLSRYVFILFVCILMIVCAVLIEVFLVPLQMRYISERF